MVKTLRALLLHRKKSFRNCIGNLAFDKLTENHKRSSSMASVYLPHYRICHITSEIFDKDYFMFVALKSSRILCNLKRLRAVIQINLQ